MFVQHLTSKTEEERILGKKNELSKVIFKHTDNGNVRKTARDSSTGLFLNKINRALFLTFYFLFLYFLLKHSFSYFFFLLFFWKLLFFHFFLSLSFLWKLSLFLFLTFFFFFFLKAFVFSLFPFSFFSLKALSFLRVVRTIGTTQMLFCCILLFLLVNIYVFSFVLLHLSQCHFLCAIGREYMYIDKYIHNKYGSIFYILNI